MKLILQKIRWKNFLSFGKNWQEVDLAAKQTTLIVGKNGAGKSTLLDAISFVLFNKAFRGVNKPQLINSLNKNDCMVEIWFNANGYDCFVRRGLKPNVFEIYKDGTLITQSADNRDYQEALEKYILRINHKTFCQVVVLGSAIFVPFMALPAAQRRAVIEDLLDLQIFSVMNKLLKERADTTEKTLTVLNSEKRVLDERLTLITKHIAELDELRSRNIEHIQEEIKHNRHEARKIEEELDYSNTELYETKQSVSHYPKLIKKENDLCKLRTQLEYKENLIDKEISFLEHNEHCPTCTQIIETSFKQDTLVKKQKEKKEYVDAASKLSGKIKDLQNEIKVLLDTKKKIVAKESIFHALEIKLSMLDDQHTKLVTELEKQPKEIDLSEIEKIKQEIATVEEKLQEHKGDKVTQGYAAVLLKDSGIKGKIIKTYVPVINQLIAKYLAALDFFVEFQLNEEFEEKIKSRGRDDFSYESFSEGEKMRLNIAILFAWRALAKLRGSIHCNLVILDELLDSSLDIEGLEDSLKLILSLTKDENVIVISHKTDQLSDRFSHVIHYEKQKGWSKRVA